MHEYFSYPCFCRIAFLLACNNVHVTQQFWRDCLLSFYYLRDGKICGRNILGTHAFGIFLKAFLTLVDISPVMLLIKGNTISAHVNFTLFSNLSHNRNCRHVQTSKYKILRKFVQQLSYCYKRRSGKTDMAKRIIAFDIFLSFISIGDTDLFCTGQILQNILNSCELESLFSLLDENIKSQCFILSLKIAIQ